MKRFALRRIFPLLVILCLCPAWAVGAQPQTADKKADKTFPEAVKIEAPDNLSTNILSSPRRGADVLAIALHGDVLEVVGREGDYYRVRIPEQLTFGYVLQAHTVPWRLPRALGPNWPLILAGVALLVAVLAAFAFVQLKARRAKRAEDRAAATAAAIRNAEESFRAGDYAQAIQEFTEYLALQGGDVRNPDVYRRLAVCYRKTDQLREAAQCWEKMRALGGLKGAEDHALGVDLMTSLGQQEQAAAIYEQLLQGPIDEEASLDIHRKLIDIYRNQKQHRNYVKHVVEVLESGHVDRTLIPSAVQFLVADGQTGLAVEASNKALIAAICEEFLEDRALTPEAERIYVKCLEYDRTDKRLHRILAEKYRQDNDYRRAVSQLTVLTQLDRQNAEEYTEEAAKVYIDSDKVAHALSEGNPQIIKKMAQQFLARSEVTSDAVATYEKVLEFLPRAVGVNKMLATVYLTRGDLPRYMEKLRLLHELDSANHDYLSDLAQCVIDNNLIEETIRQGNRELIVKILKQLVKREAYDDKAVHVLESVAKREPGNAQIQRALANAYAKRGEPARQLEHLLALSHLQPDDTEVTRQAAELAKAHNLTGMLPNKGGREVRPSAPVKPAPTKAPGPARGEEQRVITELPGDTDWEDLDRPDDKPTEGLTTPAAKPKPVPPPPPATKQEAPRQPSIHELGFPEILSDEPLPEEIAEPEPESRPQKAAREAAAAVKARIVERVESVGRKVTEQPVTTFVSHSMKGPRIQYKDEELYKPATGGLAYKSLRVLRTDGWGSWHVGVEVNTGDEYLIRDFSKGFLGPEQLRQFLEQVAEVAFNIIHENILENEGEVIGPRRARANIHPLYPYTLDDVMAPERRPNFAVRLGWIKGIVSGMAHAHNYIGLDGKYRRTLHLHLQPSTVLFQEDATTPKIANLGYNQAFRTFILAREPRWKDPGMEPAFMPPEFFRLKAPTAMEKAADIYAVGAILYFIATGDYPFEGPSFEDYKFQQTRVFPSPPRLVNPEVPDWLEPLILGCLEKEPEKRWGGMNEVLNVILKETGRDEP
ncbi:MAG: protein kinase domain-containing protein [Thermodesulfobacteriota bacterium]